MANLNQGNLITYLIRELLTSHSTNNPNPSQHRVTQFADELKKYLVEGASPNENCTEINERERCSDPNSILDWLMTFKADDDRVRSQTYRAPCCDVTLVAMHSPHCQRYGTRSMPPAHHSTLYPSNASYFNPNPYSEVPQSTPSNLPNFVKSLQEDGPPVPHTQLASSKLKNVEEQDTTPRSFTPSPTHKIKTSQLYPDELIIGDSTSESDDLASHHSERGTSKEPVKRNYPQSRRTGGGEIKLKERAYAKWDAAKVVQVNTLIEEAMRHDGDGFSNYSVKKMAEQLKVSQSSLYKYLRLTRPETEGGPRKVLDLTGRRGLTENPSPAMASYSELTQAIYNILESEESLSVTQISDKLPAHLRRTKPSILRHLKRMNCVRRTVSAITACKSILPAQAKAGGGHNLSGYWSLNRGKPSLKENVPKVSSSTVYENNDTSEQVIALRKAYADCILSLSQSSIADYGSGSMGIGTPHSLIFVCYTRWPIAEILPQSLGVNGNYAPQPFNSETLEILITVSIRSVMDYAINAIDDASVPVASTFVPFVRHTVQLINRTDYIAAAVGNHVPLVLVVDRGTCPGVKVGLDEARYDMTFTDPSHSLIYLPPDSEQLNPVTQFLEEIKANVKTSSITLSSFTRAAALKELCSSYIKRVNGRYLSVLYERTQNYVHRASNHQQF